MIEFCLVENIHKHETKILVVSCSFFVCSPLRFDKFSTYQSLLRKKKLEQEKNINGFSKNPKFVMTKWNTGNGMELTTIMRRKRVFYFIAVYSKMVRPLWSFVSLLVGCLLDGSIINYSWFLELPRMQPGA